MSIESDKKYRHKWYMEHREEQIARTKQYREEHKEELYLKRKAAARERMRRYREEHPDKVKETRQSGDYSEEEYRETLTKFKQKWFLTDRKERLKEYIDEQVGIIRRELYDVIGENGGE